MFSIIHTSSLAVLFAVLTMGACSSSEGARSDKDAASPRFGTDDLAPRDGSGAAAADFSVIFGEGGGFVGRWEGYAIRSDGVVLAWSGPTAKEDGTAVGSLPAAKMDDLWSRIQDVEFFHQFSSETGTMTAFMEVTTRDRRHRVSWIPDAQSSEHPISAIDALYRHVLQLASEAAK